MSLCFVFFKQKTAFELRISDSSSDVGSSDLGDDAHTRPPRLRGPLGVDRTGGAAGAVVAAAHHPAGAAAGVVSGGPPAGRAASARGYPAHHAVVAAAAAPADREIGRAHV